ncbi:hypothetical protein FQZ97_916490 [compost metagenome]
MARLELLRIRAYHAADAAPLDPATLAMALAAPERLATLLLRLQPALGLLDSAFAVVSLWAAHQGALALAEVDPDQAQCALVLRNGLEVEVLGIRPGDAVLIQALLRDQPLGAAAQLALTCDPAFDLGACLAYLLRAGAITHCAYDTQRPLP